MHRLLQTVEQDALTKEECARWLEWSIGLFNAFCTEVAGRCPDMDHFARTTAPRGNLENTRRHGMGVPAVSIITSQFALFLYARANYTQAESLYLRELAIDEASFRPDDPNVARDLNNLAQLLKDTNRLSDAEPLSQRCLEIFLQFTAVTSYNILTCTRSLRISLSCLKRWAAVRCKSVPKLRR